MRVVPFGLRDVHTVDAGDSFTLFMKTVVALNTKQDKRWKDQQKQNELHDLGVTTDKIKHD
jgi:hypothetical protein